MIHGRRRLNDRRSVTLGEALAAVLGIPNDAVKKIRTEKRERFADQTVEQRCLAIELAEAKRQRRRERNLWNGV